MHSFFFTLGTTDFPNLENTLAVKKVHDLVNMNGMLNKSLKGPWFSVRRYTTNSVQLVYLKDIQKELTKNL